MINNNWRCLITIFSVLLLGGCSLTKTVQIYLKKNTHIGKEIEKRLQINVQEKDDNLANLREYEQVFYQLYADKNLPLIATNHCNYFENVRSKQQYFSDLSEYIKKQEKLVNTDSFNTDKKRLLNTVEISFAMSSLEVYCPENLERFQDLRENDVRTEVEKQFMSRISKSEEDKAKYQYLFNQMYQFKDFETIGKEYCNYLKNVPSRQRYIQDRDEIIEKKGEEVTLLLAGKEKENFLTTIETAIAIASVEVRCPAQKSKLQQLQILN